MGAARGPVGSWVLAPLRAQGRRFAVQQHVSIWWKTSHSARAEQFHSSGGTSNEGQIDESRRHAPLPRFAHKAVVT